MFLRKLLFILLIIQPLMNKIAVKLKWDFDIFNELLSIFVFLGFLVIVTHRKKVNNMILVPLGFIFYMACLAILRGIYPLSFFQIIIYSQFFVYFFYFLALPVDSKTKTLIAFKKIMTYFVVIIAIIAVYEAIDHSTFRIFMGVHSVKRGINYFYLISFFGSGPSLAIFISLYVLLWHYCHYALGIKTRKKDVFFVILAIILGTLTFSRKEVLFIFLFLLFFPYPARNKLNKWIKRGIFIVGVFAGLAVYYISFFVDANTVAFDKNYIRWKIISKATEIYIDHAPFGSGAGTFGSRVSLMMPDLYQRYGIGEEMLGWQVLGNTGPIYDAFLFTFFTEIGIGIFIFLFFMYKLFEARVVVKNPYARFSKHFLVVYFLMLSLFAPMVTSNFGFIIMIFLGLMISNVTIFKFNRWYAED